jgi:class 3 adenylate cyclase
VGIRHSVLHQIRTEVCSCQAKFHHILSRKSPCGIGFARMSEGRVERRLAAILAVDVAGYSRLMGEDEEGTLAALRAVRRELGDPKIAEHRGRIVKTTGDGLLVEFASVVDAVRCAVEVQREMIARNAAAPAQRRIEFRMGINVGDGTVNLASADCRKARWAERRPAIRVIMQP